MKLRKNRIWGIMLCLVMVLGLMPATVLAARDDAANITVNKVDQDGNPLEGAAFVLKVENDTDAGSEIVYEAFSDEDGIATFTYVANGSYTLEESSAPEGYVKSDESYFLYVEDGRVILFTEEMPNGIDYSPVTFVNEEEDPPVRATITVNKTDGNGQPLAGATFVLKTDVTYEDSETVTVYEAVSDEYGIATFTDVQMGSYILEESSAPEGYVKSDESYSLYVSDDRVILFTEEMPNGIDYSPVTFVNEEEEPPVRATITVNKTDGNGQPLAGASFVLKTDVTYEDSEKEYEAVSDANGIATFTEVANGSYILEEKSAPEGYVKSDKTYSLYVSDGRVILFTEEMPNGIDYSPVTFVNEEIPVQTSEPVKPVTPGPPQTGEGNMMWAWLAIFFVSGISILAGALYSRRRVR